MRGRQQQALRRGLDVVPVGIRRGAGCTYGRGKPRVHAELGRVVEQTARHVNDTRKERARARTQWYWHACMGGLRRGVNWSSVSGSSAHARVGETVGGGCEGDDARRGGGCARVGETALRG